MKNREAVTKVASELMIRVVNRYVLRNKITDNPVLSIQDIHLDEREEFQNHCGLIKITDSVDKEFQTYVIFNDSKIQQVNSDYDLISNNYESAYMCLVKHNHMYEPKEKMPVAQLLPFLEEQAKKYNASFVYTRDTDNSQACLPFYKELGKYYFLYKECDNPLYSYSKYVNGVNFYVTLHELKVFVDLESKTVRDNYECHTYVLKVRASYHQKQSPYYEQSFEHDRTFVAIFEEDESPRDLMIEIGHHLLHEAPKTLIIPAVAKGE